MTGQVATELGRLSDSARPGAAAVVAIGRGEADLSDPEACAAAVAAHAPDAVINAAAYTAVDRAEDDEALATVVNGDAPGAIARVCADRGVPFVHISTDYVHDGSGTAPWPPDAPTAPLGAYGRSKLAGEDAVRAAGGTTVILRTSWVFSAHGANFVKTMLRLSQTRDRLTIVADQVGGPTAAADIAAACLNIAQSLKAQPELAGTYNFSGAPDVSWADFAREIFARSARDITVEDIPAASYPTPAARPANSRLDCSSLTRAFGIERPDWRASLRDVLAELEATP